MVMIATVTFFEDSKTVCNITATEQNVAHISRDIWFAIKMLANRYKVCAMTVTDGRDTHTYYDGGVTAFADMMCRELPDW